MTMFKKGTCCHSEVTISSMVYVCDGCGHTEIVKSESLDTKECPKCKSKMSLIRATGEESSTD